MSGAADTGAGGDRIEQWSSYLANVRNLVASSSPAQLHGKVTRATGMVVEASGLTLPIGGICRIESESLDQPVEAEVVGFVADRSLLMPCSDITGLAPGAIVIPLYPRVPAPALGKASHLWRRSQDLSRHMPVGPGLLGRVVNASGKTIDGFIAPTMIQDVPIRTRPINAMRRAPITERLDTGVRAIDTLVTVGRGQRLGLFAPAGVGKSVLLGMMAGRTAADVIVVALVGERGREVREFIDNTLGPSTRQRATVVAAPADEPPILKIQAANYAVRIAEYYRDQGLHVLFMMDSLTRYAMAMREVALSAGEAPATRGYPPSVFARMPEIIERAGNAERNSGSITALYTVLVEADEDHDPVGEAARSFLDGHIVLSRELAERAHYPAIDIARSVSRVMPVICDQTHLDDAAQIRRAWSDYFANRELITIGAYVPGGDPLADRAINLWPQLREFLCQSGERERPGSAPDKLLAQLADRLRRPDPNSGGAGAANSPDTSGKAP